MFRRNMGIYLDTGTEILRVFNMTSTILLLLVATAAHGAVLKSLTNQFRPISATGTVIVNVQDLGSSYEVDGSYQKQNANDIPVYMSPEETKDDDDEPADEVDEQDCEDDEECGGTDENCDCYDDDKDCVCGGDDGKDVSDCDDDDQDCDCGGDYAKEVCDRDDDDQDCDCGGDDVKEVCGCDDHDQDCDCGGDDVKEVCDCDDYDQDCDYGGDYVKDVCDCDDDDEDCDYGNGSDTKQACECKSGDTDDKTDEEHKESASGKTGDQNYQVDKEKGGNALCKLDYLPPKPKSQCCGLDSVTKDFIYGGNETELGQYPWLVYLEYNSEIGEKFYKCGGSLISARYVLTAAHCYEDPKSNIAVAVHVGDHYIHQPGPDCTKPDYCSDGDTRISIESFVKYPKYEKGSPEYDIAVIRLEEPVSFTDFVRPICLPSFDIYKDIEKIPRLYVAGWGATDRKRLGNNLNNVKHAVDLPIRHVEECSRIQLQHKVICAGETGKDSCEGDSGGPLMMADDDDAQYYLVGVVANGPTACGNGEPAVYTHVYKYVPWIYENIEA